jgi:hypothetical protein
MRNPKLIILLRHFFLDSGFFFFGQSLSNISVYPDGGFYLITNSSKYHVQVCHHFSSGGEFYINEVNITDDLNSLTPEIRAAFPSTYSFFQTKEAFTITWSVTNNHISNLFQVAFCTDLVSLSFMIVTLVWTFPMTICLSFMIQTIMNIRFRPQSVNPTAECQGSSFSSSILRTIPQYVMILKKFYLMNLNIKDPKIGYKFNFTGAFSFGERDK